MECFKELLSCGIKDSYLPVGGEVVDEWCISDGLDNGPVANVM